MGQREQIETFVPKHNAELIRFLIWFGATEEEAPDLAQEVWIKVFKSPSSFESRNGSTFRTWLKAIAKNELRIKWRSTQHRVELQPLEDFPEAESFPETESFIDRVSRDIDQKAFVKKLQSLLSENEFELLIMRYVDGKDCREIGGILNIKPNTVKTRLFHLRQKISQGKCFARFHSIIQW